MCELLGMNFNGPVYCGFSFRGFTNRGNRNPDGWGIALYPEIGGLDTKFGNELRVALQHQGFIVREAVQGYRGEGLRIYVIVDVQVKGFNWKLVLPLGKESSKMRNAEFDLLARLDH